MPTRLLLLAQQAAPAADPIPESNPFFNLTNLCLVLGIIAILIGYKMYKDKTMK